MWRITKLLGMAVLTVCVLLLAAIPASAQTGYSITSDTSYQGGSGSSQPDAGGNYNTITQGSWSTPADDSVDTLAVMFTTNGGQTWAAINVPNANITGQNTPNGTYYVLYNLPPGNYIAKTRMKSQKA